MKKIISKTIEIEAPKVMPPLSGYIESEIVKHGLSPLRWAIVDVKNKNLTDNTIVLSVSGEVL